MKLTDEQLAIITRTVIDEAARVKKDYRLRNTKLLVRKYRMLKKHCEVQDTQNEENYDEDIFQAHDLTVDVLLKYRSRTREMLKYFESMFYAYQKFCAEEGPLEKRRANIINYMYITPNKLTIMDLAELHGVDDRTIRRDLDKAIEEMSIFLFGIDGLDVKNVS